MSKRIRKWERGAADLVTIAVGLTMIAITTIGTSYSLLYGRQALIQQEHYKTALYKLRGFMEEQMALYRFSATYRADFNWFNQRKEVPFELDSPTDRDGEIRTTVATIGREAIVDTADALGGTASTYHKMIGYAEWTEPVAPGMHESESDRFLEGPNRRIELVSYFKIPE